MRASSSTPQYEPKPKGGFNRKRRWNAQTPLDDAADPSDLQLAGEGMRPWKWPGSRELGPGRQWGNLVILAVLGVDQVSPPPMPPFSWPLCNRESWT